MGVDERINQSFADLLKVLEDIRCMFRVDILVTNNL